MGVMWIIAFAILGVLGAAISRQWVPWMIRHIIDRAVRMLSEDQRERFTEEWRSHVNEIPGDAGKLIVALGFIVASSKMAGIPAAAGKRIFDMVFSALAIVLLFPVVVFVILAIKCDSPGPIFFRQRRVGLNGKQFYLIKFRTLDRHPEHPERYRVTRVGRFLRATNIDELSATLLSHALNWRRGGD
jgi:Bacterial sugar transferase